MRPFVDLCVLGPGELNSSEAVRLVAEGLQ
jgi:hypothetical protein